MSDKISTIYQSAIKELSKNNKISLFDLEKIETPITYSGFLESLINLGLDSYDIAKIISNYLDIKLINDDALSKGVYYESGILYNEVFYSKNPFLSISRFNDIKFIDGVRGIKEIKELGVCPYDIKNKIFESKGSDFLYFNFLEMISDAFYQGSDEIIFQDKDENNLIVLFKINSFLFYQPYVFSKKIIKDFMDNNSSLFKKLEKDIYIFSRKSINGDIDFKVKLFNDEVSAIKIYDNGYKILDSLGYNESNLRKFKKTFIEKNGLITISGMRGSGLSTIKRAIVNYYSSTFKEKNILYINNTNDFFIEGLTNTKTKSEDVYKNFDVIFIDGVDNSNIVKYIENLLDKGILVFAFGNFPSSIHMINFFGRNTNKEFLENNYISSMHVALPPKLCDSCKKEAPFSSYVHSGVFGGNLESAPNLKDVLFERNLFGCSSCSNRGVRGYVPLSDILIADKDLLKFLESDFSIKSIYRFLRGESWEPILNFSMKELKKGTISVKIIDNFVGKLVDSI